MVAESAVLHLVYRVINCPALSQYAVHRAHRARAVRPVLAVHKNRHGVRVVDDGKELVDVFVLHVGGEYLDSTRLERKVPDLVRIGMVVAKIHDSLYAKRNEVRHSLRGRLCAAVELV